MSHQRYVSRNNRMKNMHYGSCPPDGCDRCFDRRPFNSEQSFGRPRLYYKKRKIIRERESSRNLNNSNYDSTHHNWNRMYGTRKKDYHHIRRNICSERNCPSLQNYFSHNFQDSMEPKSTHSNTSKQEMFANKYLREKLANKKATTFSAEDKKIKAMIWQEDKMDDNEDNVDESFIFKFSSENLPNYDGKTVVGDEGVFEVKLFRCTFCNMLMMDKEKRKAHMLTEYHYNAYKNYLIKFENEKKNQELCKYARMKLKHCSC